MGHFAERAKLSDRAAKFICTLAQLIQQSGIFDGDDGLGGKVRDQGDLLVAEGTHFLAVQGEQTDQFVLFQHWDNQ